MLQSRPVDADKLANRLLEFAGDHDRSPRAPSEPLRCERAPTVDQGPDEQDRKIETAAYNYLVGDGGRPCYPIAQLEHVSKNPEEYRLLLRPFQEYLGNSHPEWQVFTGQLDRWRKFRRWQQDNRGIDDDRSFSAYVEAQERNDTDEEIIWQRASLPMTKSQYAESLKMDWENERRQRQLERRNTREFHDGGDFSDYVAAVKQRLAQHGFTRTLYLEEDLSRQTKLATWIEYLNFECWWHDQYTRNRQSLERKQNNAWKSLVESGVLRSHETAELMRTHENTVECKEELYKADRAVASAEASARASVHETEKAKHGRSRLGKQARVQNMMEAQSALARAREAHKNIKRRWDLIAPFTVGDRLYQTAKENVYRHGLLLQWILDQIPQIAEEDSSDSKGSPEQTGHEQEENPTNSQGPAPRRHTRASTAMDAPSRSPPREKQPRKRSRDDGADSTAQQQQQPKRRRNQQSAPKEPQGRRRSARIAGAQHTAPP